MGQLLPFCFFPPKDSLKLIFGKTQKQFSALLDGASLSGPQNLCLKDGGQRSICWSQARLPTFDVIKSYSFGVRADLN